MPACSPPWSPADFSFMLPALRVEVGSMIEAFIRGDNRLSRDRLAAGPPFAPSSAQVNWARFASPTEAMSMVP
jgi:hypothetical protein